jgi:glycosyltransferase involved in cell wall biosynthesis
LPAPEKGDGISDLAEGFMKVSIVIPAYNAERTIAKAVVESLAQAGRGIAVEVVVVDDGSSDNSAEVARSAGARVISQRNSGPAAARNRGWRAATGEVICFTDSDCVPAPDWLASLLQGFMDWKVGAVAGSYDIANRDSWLARWVHREIMERHERMPAFVRAFGTYNVALPRYVLDATGGFDPTYRRASGEDNDLSYRILKMGWRIAFMPQAKVAHHHPERLWKYLKDQARHGFWRMKLYRAHPDMISGDDYTRRRDRLEPILILGMVFLAGLAPLGVHFPLPLLLGCMAGYLLLHLPWPLRWWLQEGKAEALPYAGVAALRGLARTLGMCAGLVRFAPRARRVVRMEEG